MDKSFEISVDEQLFSRLLDGISNAELDQYLSNIDAEFSQVRWWWLAGESMIMDATTGLLWDAKPNINHICKIALGRKYSSLIKAGGMTNHWRLPLKDELANVAKEKSFPLREGVDNFLLGKRYWLVAGGGFDTHKNQWTVDPAREGNVLATVSLPVKKIALRNLIIACAERDWSVRPHGLTRIATDRFISCYDIIRAHIHHKSSGLSTVAIMEVFAKLDYNSVRLPKMDSLRFTDPHQGLWEFYAPPGASGNRQILNFPQQLRSRNPEDDIREGYVAIDFGTSSTVVAFKEQGRDQLLRIGLADFSLPPQPKHYENPTVLEFLDFARLLADWQGHAYRPMVSWDSVHCSHEARASLRDNDTNPKVVGSVMERLKQWALRGSQHAVVSITDQDHGREYPLPPLTERNPVKGKALTVGKDYPFDPIELYAWFLGMTINWRGRGLFLHYFMTFPVKYRADIKTKILASFRRGLQRSLPEALIASPRFEEFMVEERASEPAAFAASALQAYGIEPTAEGVAYAVFDFGGGTTDFDYGYYRLPTDAEARRNAEHLLEHFSADGDEFLGGENLLENMAYRVFCDNLEVCRKKQIAFTKPLDAADFPGSEVLLVRTQAAITNTTMLMSRLRPLWEKGERNNTNTVKIKLLDRQGTSVDCDFAIDEEKLLDYLRTRIRQGLLNFFTAMKQAFTRQGDKGLPKQVHILLAGNACHSQIVQEMFGIPAVKAVPKTQAQQQQKAPDTTKTPMSLFQQTREMLAVVFGESLPRFEIHPPLAGDPKEPYKPTAKTGVALGLLHLCPGETLHVINHAAGDGKESPFLFYVGGFVRGVFQVRLERGAAYGGAWQELGMVGEHIFNLVFTQAANALNGGLRRGDLQLTERRLKFPAASDGDMVFARAHGPDSIELVTAVDLAAAEAGRVQHAQVLTLAVNVSLK